MKKLGILLLAATSIFSACRKTDQPPAPTAQPSKMDLLRDSVYLYSKEVYLWSDMIPAYNVFNPRQYNGATELETAQKVMSAIKAVQPLDRWSFVTTPDVTGGLSSGEDKNLGFFVKGATVGSGPTRWYVNYVYSQSSAGQANVERGWYINKINGTPVAYDQAGADLLNNIFFGTAASANFEFVKPDGNAVTVSISKTSYTANSVLHKSVISTGGKKVGYLVFNQFFGAPSRTELADAFSYFENQNINELVVDLRNNGGGVVQTQDFLANRIVPASASGKVMYQYIFNQTLQNNQHKLLRKYSWADGNYFSAQGNSIPFAKAGNLSLSRVFFITTGSTASASELLINNLKPYMDVKVVGTTTYGKPAGYFPITIYNYDIYPISFKTVNSRGDADYFTGFKPDFTAPDGVNKNWGDETEASLSAVLKYISTGSFGRFSPEAEAQLRSMKDMEPLNRQLNENRFIGMFPEKE